MKYEPDLSSILANAREIRERVKDNSEARAKSVGYFANLVCNNAEDIARGYSSFIGSERTNALLRRDNSADETYRGCYVHMKNLQDNLGRLAVAIYGEESLVERLYNNQIEKTKDKKTKDRMKGFYNEYFGRYPSNTLTNSTPLPQINNLNWSDFFSDVQEKHDPSKHTRTAAAHAGEPEVYREGLTYLTSEGGLARDLLSVDVGAYLGLASSALKAITHQEDTTNLMQRSSTDKKRNFRHYMWDGQKRNLVRSAKTLGLATAMCTVAGLGLFGWGSFETLKQTEEKLEKKEGEAAHQNLVLEMNAFSEFVTNWNGIYVSGAFPHSDLGRKKVAKEIMDGIEKGYYTTNNFNMDLVNIFLPKD